MESKKQKNEIGYNTWSTFYDDYPNPTVAIDELSFPEFYSSLKRKNILEIGCGTGRHTARLLENENWVTGVDVSEGMLDQARRKIQSNKLSLVHGDFITEVIPNGPFDAIVLSLVLEHISNLDSFFRKANQLIRPCGWLLISEIHPYRTANGTFAHFKNADGRETQLTSFAHSEKEIINAAETNGFKIDKSVTVLGNKELVQLNSVWEKHFNNPLIQIWSMTSPK